MNLLWFKGFYGNCDMLFWLNPKLVGNGHYSKPLFVNHNSFIYYVYKTLNLISCASRTSKFLV